MLYKEASPICRFRLYGGAHAKWRRRMDSTRTVNDIGDKLPDCASGDY
jgi:hypothetical protein